MAAEEEDVATEADLETAQSLASAAPAPTATADSSSRAALPRKFAVTRPTEGSPLPKGDDVRVEDRYRVENDDGSITWGYKAADGSFKEETIGADCITRGRSVYDHLHCAFSFDNHKKR